MEIKHNEGLLGVLPSIVYQINFNFLEEIVFTGRIECHDEFQNTIPQTVAKFIVKPKKKSQ